jgi:hypothetical protein
MIKENQVYNRVCIKKPVFFVLAAVSVMSVFSGGRKDIESRTVETPGGFTESIDIENKSPGKYNFYFEARDKGGNTTIVGPENIYIDPESGLPVVTITNPRENMLVRGNLNIAGTCVDDDGVGYVELWFNGDPSTTVRAGGTEFWSYYYETVNFPDKLHSISARGVDSNGLPGKEVTVHWNLDRGKPETKVTSHEMGALVSGRIVLKGTARDGNGLSGLSYSLDGGQNYVPLSFKYDKKTDEYNYELKVDTRSFEDGPAVIWFRARDNMGSIGGASHLVYVDNTGPEVEIVYPGAGEAVNGIFTAAGSALDTVGLASLSWKLGKETGEFPLTKGNPYWVKEFDIRGQKLKNLELEIRAVDLSGNLSTAKRKIPVDQEAGLPVVSLREPEPAAVIAGEGRMNIRGLAGDDNGVEAVLYALDGGAVREISCSGFFQIPVSGIPEGVHDLEVWARDITGVEGPKVRVKGIIAPGAAPEPRITGLRYGSGKTAVTEDFYTGKEIKAESGAALALAVNSGSALASLSWRFEDGAPVSQAVKAKAGVEYRQDIPLPGDIPYGLVRLELKAMDIHGREGVREEYIILRPGDGREINAAGEFRWVSPGGTPDGGRILIDTQGQQDQAPLMGLYSGRPLQHAELSGPGAENFRAELDQFGRLLMRAAGEGSFGPVFLNLTDEAGLVREAGPYNFLVDFADPLISLDENPDGRWVRNEVGVKFSGGDANGIRALEVSFDLGGTWQPLVSGGELGTAKASTVFERALDISGLEDGAVNVDIRIIDGAGRSAVASFAVQKDTRPPEGRLIVPVSGARVNGIIRLGAAVKETGRLAAITCRRPAGGTEEEPVPEITKVLYSGADSVSPNPLGFLDLLLDSAEIPLAENMSFVFEDAAGNSSTLDTWPFVIDNEIDVPVIEIGLPPENEIITSGFVLSGVMYDDDAVKRVYWRIDDGEEQIFEGANGYSIPIPLLSLSDNEHTITVSAEDIYGARSAPATRTVRVSMEEPKAQVSLPAFSQIFRETVVLSGTASDENGISLVQVSLDNGNSYNDASGTTEWSYQFNSKILKDGTHVVFVRVWDGYDITALYSSLINIDNTAPELILESPADGTVTTGSVYIAGRAVDAIQLDTINIEVRSLEGKEVPEEIKSRHVVPSSILTETLDLSSLSNGIYNIEVCAKDRAENITRVSRNLEIFKDNRQNFVDNLYPLNGEHVQGAFNLYGYVGGADKAVCVTLSVNGIDAKTVEVTGEGYYRFALSGEDLKEGLNSLVVRSEFDGKEIAKSSERNLYYTPSGPWVTIDSFNMGDFAYHRPWLTGRGGYALNHEDEEILADKKAGKELKAGVEAKKLEAIELSFDNGRTFFRAEGGKGKDGGWRYRLETGEMSEGLHYLIVRAVMANGETAVTRTLIQVDKTPPWVRIVSPQAGGRYNQSLEYTAFAGDDVELKSLGYYLRKGDKAFYGVPGFIQGLYFESTIPPFIKQIWNDAPNVFAGGATYMDFGIGLSFFGDNVKVQAQYGFMTQELYESLGGTQTVRYGGHVLGLKLLANLYTLPFGSFAGPGWEWLSASFALGANFSLFDLGGQGYTQSGAASWLSALLFQVEFPKITIQKRNFLKTFSLFTEGQLWFVPTDVKADEQGIKTIIPHIVVGLRMYIF